MEPDEHRYRVTLHRCFVFHFGPAHFHVSAVYEAERKYLFLDLLLSEYYVSLFHNDTPIIVQSSVEIVLLTLSAAYITYNRTFSPPKDTETICPVG